MKFLSAVLLLFASTAVAQYPHGQKPSGLYTMPTPPKTQPAPLPIYVERNGNLEPSSLKDARGYGGLQYDAMLNGQKIHVLVAPSK